MYGYIYKITVPTSTGIYYYIGQKKSNTLVENYFGSGKKINDWFLKHTKYKSRCCPKSVAENFGIIREIICWCNSQIELSEQEKYYINQQRISGNCLNIADGGESGWSKESHAKSVETRKANGSYKHTPEQKLAASLKAKGKKLNLSQENRQKLSDKMKGANNPMSKEKGGHTKEWRELHSSQLKGKDHTYCSKKIICLENNLIFNSITEASKWVGCSRTLISMICRKAFVHGGIVKTAKGYHFCFLDEYNLS